MKMHLNSILFYDIYIFLNTACSYPCLSLLSLLVSLSSQAHLHVFAPWGMSKVLLN